MWDWYYLVFLAPVGIIVACVWGLYVTFFED